MFGKTAPVGRWGDDLAGWEAKLADQEVDEIYQDWLFDKRRLDAIPPAYQLPASGSVFTPEEIGVLMTDYNARAYQRRFGAAGEPVGPEELEPLYRALHDKRLGRYRDWLQQNAVLDETGNPAKLYHGTGNVFDEFESAKFGTGAGGNLVGSGVYLSNNPSVSSDYAMNSWRKSGLFNDAPANVRMHHAIGPVADFTTPGGLEAADGVVGNSIYGFGGLDAMQMREKRLLNDMYRDAGDYLDDAYHELDRPEDFDRLNDVFAESSIHMREMSDMWDSMNIPSNGLEYARQVKRYLDEPGSFGQVLPGNTGVKHPGGLLMGAGDSHDAYVMFDPKNVVPVNPSPGMLQILAERFKDPATGALPFSMLAAMGLGGAVSQGGQPGVH
jgi:hypothetical protein